MPEVRIIELSTQTRASHGYDNEHAWVEVVFDDGNTVQLRVDSRDTMTKLHTPSVGIKLNDDIGQSITLKPTGGLSPHGRPWAAMTDDELRQASSWCMLPENHDNLTAELKRRREERGQ